MSRVVGAEARRFERFTGRSSAGLLAVFGLGAAFGVLLLLVRFEWTPLNRLDVAATSSLNAVVVEHRWLVGVLETITKLGGSVFLWWLGSVVFVGLLIRGQRRPAAFLAVTGVGAAMLSPGLKLLVGRLRPVVDMPVAVAPGHSFPSGHALAATVTYGALLLIFLPVFSRRLRAVAVAAVVAVVLLVGVTRVGLGVHYLSDVVAGWLLGAAWLGVTASAFRLWRREAGLSAVPLRDGIEPEAAAELAPAPRERHALAPRPWAAVARIVTGWVLVFGALVAVGLIVVRHTGGTVLDTVDTAVPQWFADRRTPGSDDLSWWLSKAGDTHSILAVSLVFCPLTVAILRRWRPAVFVALAMFGEVTLFLATSRAVGRSRPDVPQLDGSLPTSSFPSGHIAATLCLYTAIALVVVPRTRAWWRWLAIAAAIVMPLAVALSRLYRGMHHPTDVLGALLLTALWLGLLWWVVKPSDPDPSTRPLPSADREPAHGAVLVGATGRERSG